MAEEINYHPYSGEILPSGNLKIPTFGRSSDGEIWDGIVEVTPKHPNYALWRSQINDKETYHKALKEEQKRAREQKRQKREP